MSNIFATSPYRGTTDFYPEDLLKKQYLFKIWKEVFFQNGFEEYETSIIENAELYIVKSGEELGGQQLYSFKDKGDRHIALRPEQTPSLARMVANKFNELKYPLKWFCIPNCFRYERPQKGRNREFWQLNADIIGSSAGGADLEMLLLVARSLTAFGATSEMFEIRFNHRKLLDLWIQKNGFEAQKNQVYQVLDKWWKIKESDRKQFLIDALNETEWNDKLNKIWDLTDKNSTEYQVYVDLGVENFNELKLIFDFLKQSDKSNLFDLNPTIVRGLAYYDGLVFEAFDKNPENSRALFGGGRYDNLMDLFGQSLPAIGVGIGDAPVMEFLEGWKLYPDFKDTQNKIGILPKTETDLIEVFEKIIPKILAEKKSYEINYEFDRSENKRFKSLKKKGLEGVIKVGW